MKVDHAGEHGAVNIYRAQLFACRWRRPDITSELREFLDHEMRHREIFAAELIRRGRPRCRSYHLCGLGGFALGLITGICGRASIAATVGVFWPGVLLPVVSWATEAVIWLGMRL